MKVVEIVGYKRENLGKKEAKVLREEGYVPSVLYGGENQVHFYAPAILFRPLVYTPDAYQVKLNVEGDEYDCILQDTQFHPVSEILMHADFLQISEDKPVKMEIPVSFVGKSPGMRSGGKLRVQLKKLKVKALPQNLPDTIEVDISGLELGKSVKVKEVKAEDFEILNNISIPIASVETPRAMRSKQSAEEGGEEEEAAVAEEGVEE